MKTSVVEFMNKLFKKMSASTTFLIILTSYEAFATSPQGKNSACETTRLSRLEFIQAIASSEALAKLQGPRRDVSAIEVFALSNSGRVARINVTFSGSVGYSKPITLRASINCDAGGILELE